MNKELISNIHILHTETLKNDMINLCYDDFNSYDNIGDKTLNYSMKLINDFVLFNYKKY